MSRIGKNAIEIPNGTEVKVVDSLLSVKGPQGTLEKTLPDVIQVTIDGNQVTVTPKDESKHARSLWGTFASHIQNMVKGVNEKYTKKLEVQGVGYKVEMEGKNIKLSVGFSHPVVVETPEGIEVALEKNVISVTGIDKEKVGQFAANVRAVKKPEPYKGKGIRYEGEYVREKQGKKAVA